MKANQELKNMLVKEVNDFQMELYKFMIKTRETQARVCSFVDFLKLSNTEFLGPTGHCNFRSATKSLLT